MVDLIANNTPDLLAALVSDLTSMEGVRLQVYDDVTGRPIVPGYLVKGHPTIGRGRALDVKGISNDESLLLLRNDITGLLVWCEKNIDFFPSLNAVRQRVIINMCYQMGEGGFLSFHNLIGAIETQNWQAAHDAMLDSGWATETPARAQTLANWMLTGVV